MGPARGGWGWGWDGFGVGLGTGLLVAGATLPYYSGTRLRLSGYLCLRLSLICLRLVLGYGYRRLIMGAYYPRYRYAGYPYRRVYYGYGGYPYRRSQRVVACEVETTLKRPPSGGLCCFE